MEARLQSNHVGQQRPATSFGTKVHGYVQSHRKVVAIATIVTVAAAFITPIAIQAASNDMVTTMQQDNQASEQAETKAESLPPSEQEPQESRQSTQTQSDEGATSNRSETNVTVNGERVEVPENGSYSKTIKDGNSRTNINVESNHSSTSSGNSSTNNSSVNVNIKSESHSSSSD